MSGVAITNEFEADEAELNENIFGYYINLDERGDFYADVRDVDGNTVYEIRGLDFFDDGFMSDKYDLIGLELLLTKLEVIPEGSDLLEMAEFESRVDELYELKAQRGPRLG